MFERWRKVEGEKQSFSQCGEDRIIDFLFMCLRIEKPTYLDIGAHHPTYLNNTYLFHQKGSTGVCVEPDPVLFNLLKKTRPGDLCLNMGVGAAGSEAAEFFVFNEKSLSTFDAGEARRFAGYPGREIVQVLKVPVIGVNDLIIQHCKKTPHFISLDVEGMDEEILRALDFERFRPEVLCVETLTYAEDKTERKLTGIVDFLTACGYFAYGDTYINTIFVSREAWAGR